MKKGQMNFFSMLLMPTVGASIHIIQKFLFECKALNIHNEIVKFQKPYFFTWLASFGMFIVFIVNTVSKPHLLKNKYFTKAFLPNFLLLSVATFFNLTAGVLSNVSSLYLNYSVSLMLRSSTVIFGALISTYYLKKPLCSYQWYGVGLTLIAIVFVSIAALLGGSKTTHREASSLVIFIFVVVRTLSKSLQAISMLIEEKVMKTSGITPTELCGLNGIWSMLFSTAHLPLDDMRDTVCMIQNSSAILWLSIASIAVYAIWNILALQITSKASAVARMVFDQLTIVVVWVVQLSIYWTVVGTKYEEQFIKTGEAWTKYSWIQLFGFAIMVLGAAVYQNIIKLPVLCNSHETSSSLCLIQQKSASLSEEDILEEK